MKQKQKIGMLVIFILASSILFINIVGAVQTEEVSIAPDKNVPSDSFFGRLISKFTSVSYQSGTFTVYGDELGCDKYPSGNSPVTFKNSVGKTIVAESGESVFVNWFRGSPYNGQYSDHTNDNRQFLGEDWINEGDSTSWVCDASSYWDNDCYVDWYVCQIPCYSNSDCSSGEICDKSVLSNKIPNAGVCKVSTPTHTTRVYTCANGDKDYIRTVTHSNVNFCNDPDDDKYLIGSTDQCLSYEPSICSEAPYTKHNTKRCFSDDVYWFDTDNSRNDKYDECDNNGCTNGKCGDDTTDTTTTDPPASTTDPEVNVIIYDINVPTSVKAGDLVKVDFKVKNNGPTRNYLIETGIIPKETADEWEFSYSIFDWFNTQWKTECCNNQPNIFAKTTELKTGEVDTFSIKIPQAPYSEIADLCYDNTYWSGTGEYVVYFIVKNKCFKDGGLENVYETRTITITEEETSTEEDNGVVDGNSQSITWGEFYSMDDEKFGKGDYSCKDVTDCELKKDYNVSCSKDEIFREREFKILEEECDSALGWWDDMVRGVFKHGSFDLIKIDFCGSYADSYTKYKEWRGTNGICLAEPTTWYGKLWDSALKMSAGLGFPAQYVVMITIMLLLMIFILLFNQINK